MVDLVIEDGSLVEGANSFSTLDEGKEFLDARGFDYEDDDIFKYALVKAYDFLNHYDSRLKGTKVNFLVQGSIYPRKGIFIEGVLQDTTLMPKQAKEAQIVVAYYLMNDVDLYNEESSGEEALKSIKIGPITETYQDSSSASGSASFPLVEQILEPLFKFHSGALKAYRSL